jgi:hypothetical protein
MQARCREEVSYSSIVDGDGATGGLACCRYYFNVGRGDGGHSERREVVSEASTRRGCPPFSSQPRDLFVESFVPRLV